MKPHAPIIWISASMTIALFPFSMLAFGKCNVSASETVPPSSVINVPFFEQDVTCTGVWQVVYSIICAALVGLSGILPLILIPLESGEYLHSKNGQRSLNYWLSFALGSMLGDVFFHLLPESWALSVVETLFPRVASFMGLWTLIGVLSFFIIEKIFIQTQSESVRDGDKLQEANIKVEGYLNLGANVVDNFTHGLAVGGSFLVSNQLGFLTTTCILIHEIPHEISDFVMLLRAGFNRYAAAKAQLVTALGSVVGAVFALTADSLTTGYSKAYILPFTSGGFLYIALVSVAPTLLREHDVRQSLCHVLLIAAGLSTMMLLSWCV